MNYGVENRQQLPHHGHEGDLRGFTGGAQVLIERHDDRVPARCHQGCHLVQEGQGTVLHIRIAGGTGAGPDEVRWLFHRLSRTWVETLSITVSVFLRHQASGCCEVVGYDAECPLIIRCDGRSVEGTGKAPFF